MFPDQITIGIKSKFLHKPRIMKLIIILRVHRTSHSIALEPYWQNELSKWAGMMDTAWLQSVDMVCLRQTLEDRGSSGMQKRKLKAYIYHNVIRWISKWVWSLQMNLYTVHRFITLNGHIISAVVNTAHQQPIIHDGIIITCMLPLLKLAVFINFNVFWCSFIARSINYSLFGLLKRPQVHSTSCLQDSTYTEPHKKHHHG